MWYLKTLATTAFVLTLWVPLFSQADDLFTSQLVDEARVWQNKNRNDLAADAWRKLLVMEPRHPEALVSLGIIEARSGNMAAAEELRAKASRLPKPPAGLARLARMLVPPKEEIVVEAAAPVPVAPPKVNANPTPKVVTEVVKPPVEKTETKKAPAPAKKIVQTPPPNPVAPAKRQPIVPLALTPSSTLAKPTPVVQPQPVVQVEEPPTPVEVKRQKNKPKPCREIPPTSALN
jgi:hypothetical protein